MGTIELLNIAKDILLAQGCPVGESAENLGERFKTLVTKVIEADKSVQDYLDGSSSDKEDEDED